MGGAKHGGNYGRLCGKSENFYEGDRCDPRPDQMGGAKHGGKGNLTKLKSLLSHPPPMPKVKLPKMGGRKHGGRKVGGISLAPSPPMHTMMKVHGGRKHGGLRPYIPNEPQLLQTVPGRLVQSKEGIDSESNYGRGRHGGLRPYIPNEPQLLQTVPGRLVQSKEGIDSESNYGRGRHGGRKPSARGAIVKKVMQEHGLSLPQASKYVKEHGLY